MMRTSSFWRLPVVQLFFVAACLLVALGWREALTARMSLHMLVQIPLLVLAGIFAQQAWFCWRTRGARESLQHQRAHRWTLNEYGIPGLLLVSLVGASWMLPKALDDALTDWRVALFKYLGLPVCGWILRDSLRRTNLVVKLFMVGNFCWMSAIVGITYMDQPVRLCNAYLHDDQQWSGRGLIALAVLIPLFWLLKYWQPWQRRR